METFKLSEEARAAKREYNRAWRKRNAEHVREYNRRYNAQYWQRKAEEAAAKKEPPRD